MSNIQENFTFLRKNSSYCLKLVLSGIGKGSDHSIIQYVCTLEQWPRPQHYHQLLLFLFEEPPFGAHQ
jgi:hypothetical protein